MKISPTKVDHPRENTWIMLPGNDMEDRPHPEQGYRACLGIMRMEKIHSGQRLEAACWRAGQLKSFSYKTVKNILASGMYSLPLDEDPPEQRPAPHHENVSGADYYSQ